MGSSAPLIQLIAEKCQEFSNSWYDKNVLKDLSNLAAQLRSDDLNFNIAAYQFDVKSPTLHVMPIYYDNDMTITLYVLKGNATVPIHDHPSMYSLIRVLEGKLQIAGYTKTDSPRPNRGQTVHVKPGTLRVLGNSERTYVTTPTADNLHSLRAVGGPAAYVDILVPPFEPGVRDRTQFEVANPTRGLDEADYLTLRKLEPVPISIREVEYRGPKVALRGQNGARGRTPNRPASNGRTRPASTGRAAGMARAETIQEGGKVFTVVCPTCSTEIAWRQQM